MLVVQGLIARGWLESAGMSGQEAHEALAVEVAGLLERAVDQKAGWLVLKAQAGEAGALEQREWVVAWLDEVRAKQRRSKRVLWPVGTIEQGEPMVEALLGWALLAQETHTEVLAMQAAWWRCLEQSDAAQPYHGEKGAVVTWEQMRAPSSYEIETFRHLGCDFWIADLTDAGGDLGDWEEALEAIEAWRSAQPRWKPLLLAGVTQAQRESLLVALEPRRSRFLGLLWS